MATLRGPRQSRPFEHRFLKNNDFLCFRDCDNQGDNNVACLKAPYNETDFEGGSRKNETSFEGGSRKNETDFEAKGGGPGNKVPKIVINLCNFC